MPIRRALCLHRPLGGCALPALPLPGSRASLRSSGQSLSEHGDPQGTAGSVKAQATPLPDPDWTPACQLGAGQAQPQPQLPLGQEPTCQGGRGLGVPARGAEGAASPSQSAGLWVSLRDFEAEPMTWKDGHSWALDLLSGGSVLIKLLALLGSVCVAGACWWGLRVPGWTDGASLRVPPPTLFQDRFVQTWLGLSPQLNRKTQCHQRVKEPGTPRTSS